MSNVVALNNWNKNNEEEIRVLYREEENPEMIPVLYMYGDSVDELCGTHSIIDEVDFASIEILREEIQEQLSALETGIDKYGEEIDIVEISPWEDDELLVCKEGVFTWDWDIEDYVLIGNLHRTERRKIVTFKNDVAVNLGSTALLLKRCSSYRLDGEYVTYTDGRNPIVNLVIHGNYSTPIAVPYDPSILMITTMDFALISDTEEESDSNEPNFVQAVLNLLCEQVVDHLDYSLEDNEITMEVQFESDNANDIMTFIKNGLEAKGFRPSDIKFQFGDGDWMTVSLQKS